MVVSEGTKNVTGVWTDDWFAPTNSVIVNRVAQEVPVSVDCLNAARAIPHFWARLCMYLFV